MSTTCRTLEEADASGVQCCVHVCHETFLYVVRLVWERRKRLPTYAQPCLAKKATTSDMIVLAESEKPCLDRRSLAPTETCTLRRVVFSNKLVTSRRKAVLGF